MSDWRDHCDLIVAFDEKLHRQARWREFCVWLDSEDEAVDFMADLLAALQKGVASYDPSKGASVSYWVTRWHLRPVVTKDYVNRYNKWRKQRGLTPLSLDKELAEDLRGTDLLSDDYADPATGETTDGSRSQQTAFRYDDVEPVATPLTTPAQRSLLYRLAWQAAATSRGRQREVSETATDVDVCRDHAEPGLTQAVLTRRFWWRVLAQ